MLKPGKSFKISKNTKRALATILDAHQRGVWRRAMIDAQLASEQLVRTPKADRGNGKANYAITGSAGVATE